jgi:hypothetical protein
MSRTVGHHAPWLLAILVGSLIAMTLVPYVAAVLTWYVLAAMLVVALVLGISILAHNRRLCERCIASMPLDASTVAVRFALRFRVAHLFESKLIALGYLAVVAGSSFFYTHPVGRYGWAVVEASLIYLLFVYVTHQRLQPWCPYCKTGGEEVVTPTRPSPISSPA